MPPDPEDESDANHSVTVSEHSAGGRTVKTAKGTTFIPKLSAKDLKTLVTIPVKDSAEEESEQALQEWINSFKGECDRIETFFLQKLGDLIV